VLGYIDSGKQERAELIQAGRQVEQVAGGYYLEPSIFAGVQPNTTSHARRSSGGCFQC
jgi:acyl-CoA reductase-like NAD-dependent aldehyde dehydrogenase